MNEAAKRVESDSPALQTAKAKADELRAIAQDLKRSNIGLPKEVPLQQLGNIAPAPTIGGTNQESPASREKLIEKPGTTRDLPAAGFGASAPGDKQPVANAEKQHNVEGVGRDLRQSQDRETGSGSVIEKVKEIKGITQKESPGADAGALKPTPTPKLPDKGSRER
ncbi:hypothetical protein [Fimbriiglobus ruber]|uniref:Uncharacterized protein n=1 Tax=Fimbriiglobus ruber TaxID=1908690 RepID=A0A225DYT0_9BACT|nr:hypothetical protein [Fimbriiglobus ruber]OWK46482.1 hypothetical protein FRUB_00181 [Fimbriiglobus ruber]